MHLLHRHNTQTYTCVVKQGAWWLIKNEPLTLSVINFNVISKMGISNLTNYTTMDCVSRTT